MEARPGLPHSEWQKREAIAAAERERVAAIESLRRPGQEKIIDDIMAACQADPKCTPEMAALKILREERSPAGEARRMLAAHKKAGGSVLADDAVNDPTLCQCGHAQSDHNGDTGPCTAQSCDCQQFDTDPPASAPTGSTGGVVRRILAAHKKTAGQR